MKIPSNLLVFEKEVEPVVDLDLEYFTSILLGLKSAEDDSLVERQPEEEDDDDDDEIVEEGIAWLF